MKWQPVLVASLISGWLCCQTPPQQPEPGDSKPKSDSRVDRRADEMREQIDKNDKQVNSHVKVAARLKNGNKLIGVVKDGRLVERVDGLRFVDAQAREQGAGIRLWYSGGTRNYVFVPFRDLQGYQVLQRLSNKQLKQLEEEMQMAERLAEERAAAQAKAAKGKAEAAEVEDEKAALDLAKVAGGEEKPAEPTAEELQKKAQEAQWAELLKSYPPKEGWNEAKRNEIDRRLVVIGANPSDFEKAFVKQFAEWMKACEHAGIDPSAFEAKKETKQDRRDKRRDRSQQQ